MCHCFPSVRDDHIHRSRAAVQRQDVCAVHGALGDRDSERDGAWLGSRSHAARQVRVRGATGRIGGHVAGRDGCVTCTSCPLLWTIALPVAEVTWKVDTWVESEKLAVFAWGVPCPTVTVKGIGAGRGGAELVMVRVLVAGVVCPAPNGRKGGTQARRKAAPDAGAACAQHPVTHRLEVALEVKVTVYVTLLPAPAWPGWGCSH